MEVKTEVFEAYLDCVNNIDDFLEYRYKAVSKEDLRNQIMSYIDDLTNKVIMINGGERNENI